MEQVEHRVTGFLLLLGDAETMVFRIGQTLSNGDLRRELGAQAARVARSRLNLERQMSEYLKRKEESQCVVRP